MITQLTEDTIGVTVPEDIAEIALYYFVGTDGVLYLNMGQIDASSETLPAEHKWTLIGKASALTEDQWAELVGEPVYDNGGTPDENGIDKIYAPWVETDFPYDTATQSGLSLLKKHNLNPDTTIILKKQ